MRCAGVWFSQCGLIPAALALLINNNLMDITIPILPVPPLFIFRALTVLFPFMPPDPTKTVNTQRWFWLCAFFLMLNAQINQNRTTITIRQISNFTRWKWLQSRTEQQSPAPRLHDYTVGSGKLKSTVVCGILCSLALKYCSCETAAWISLWSRRGWSQFTVQFPF